MAKTIIQSAKFPASPKTLYRMFMSAKEHSAACGGGPAKIVPRVGGKFTLFGGALTGRTLLLKPGRMIVQAWRSSAFKPADPDSILILSFSGDAKSGTISMVHAQVPDHDAAGVRKGWPAYYWGPWKAYLEGKGGKAKKMGGKRR
jgi:activator of HSP90 ATPase